MSVAFIERELDGNAPPVYCECAEGYEDPREYVYLLHKSLYGMILSKIQSPRAWYQLWCSICTSFGLQKLVTDGCEHIKYVNDKKIKQHTPKINLNDLAKHLKQLPTHDRIYPDCPHDTAIIIVVTYVDDNLVITNCKTIRQQFAAHCNKRVRFNDEDTQYDWDPITGAASASQEVYINKILARCHMSDCNPTKIPCSGKLDEVMTSLQQVPAVPNPARQPMEHGDRRNKDALLAGAAGAGGCARSLWPATGPLIVRSARIRRARPCRGRFQ